MSETANEQIATEVKIKPEDIQLPPNSFWPPILALGLALIIGGLAVDLTVIIMGIFVSLVGIFGWFVVPVNSEKNAK